ncbi:MAG: primosomal protein N' [Dehalococcoidales bacterium]|nr:primosomal protein N' [Dehalococcoidales bacterium]
MPYAEVSVNSPIAQRRTFSYAIPSELKIEIGQAVWVPFGEKILQGIVMELTAVPSVAETREIEGIIEAVPLLSPAHVLLAGWLSEYYLSSLFEAVALMLPPGFERKVVTSVRLSPHGDEKSSDLSPDQEAVLALLRQEGEVALKKMEKTFGVKRMRRILPDLIRRRLVVRSYALEKPRVKPRLVSCLFLKNGVESIQKLLEGLPQKAFKQAGLLSYISENPGQSVSDACKKTGCSRQTVNSLVEKDIIEIREIQVDRDPLALHPVNLSFPLSLTAAQEKALQAICSSMGKGKIPHHPEVFLLHGVTGSGKTEIYLRALEEAVKRGRRGIVLVPEIAMTPQVIERFQSRFPGRVAVLHSELSLGMRFDEWWRIRKGEFDVVIGPRSAVFAPQPDLGLVIMDEEHEWTYKQQDVSPRYHARQAAEKLVSLSGATLVLGSATPDIESYFKASTDEYKLLELPGRIRPDRDSRLPPVEIVDLKSELKSGNLGLFSRSLLKSIEEALNGNEQIILFLNRRGSASCVECRNCGWVVRCRRCDIPLSYHFAEEKLVCHQCNYRCPVPKVCPRCRSPKIKYLGAGTETLQAETARVFPGARILRWDSDVLRGRGQSHQSIFTRFKAGEADILIGTQMVAKGLDIPGITLVGVVNADISLNLPDFRAGERTFQLLSQVAGRAGRGSAGGKVIIQTYSPGHYAVTSAAGHDYLSFYRREMRYRRELNYPPFSRLARLVYTNSGELRCMEETGRMARLLTLEKDIRGISGFSLIGPAPAYLHRLRGNFRWHLILRAPDPSTFLSSIAFPRGWTVDIDPVGMS